jgi:hypothetical protein
MVDKKSNSYDCMNGYLTVVIVGLTSNCIDLQLDFSLSVSAKNIIFLNKTSDVW